MCEAFRFPETRKCGDGFRIRVKHKLLRRAVDDNGRERQRLRPEAELETRRTESLSRSIVHRPSKPLLAELDHLDEVDQSVVPDAVEEVKGI